MRFAVNMPAALNVLRTAVSPVKINRVMLPQEKVEVILRLDGGRYQWVSAPELDATR